MKKLLLSLLLAFASIGTAFANLADCQLWIDGIRITASHFDSNGKIELKNLRSNFSGDIYVQENSNGFTINLVNVFIPATDRNAISFGDTSKEFVLYIEGSNQINVINGDTGVGILYRTKNLRIAGFGTLDITQAFTSQGRGHYGLIGTADKFTIGNSTINLNNMQYAIMPENSSQEFIIKKAKLTFTSCYEYFREFKSVTFDGSLIRDPAGAYYDADSKYLRTASGGWIFNRSYFEIDRAKTYGIGLSDLEVNELNKDNLYDALVATEPDKIAKVNYNYDSSIIYDEDYHTLYTENIYITASGDNSSTALMYSGQEPLTLSSLDRTVLASNGYWAIQASGPIKITGKNLTVRSDHSTTGAGLQAYADITFKDATGMTFSGYNGGIYTASSKQLTFNGCDNIRSYCRSQEKSGISGFSALNLIDSELVNYLNKDEKLYYNTTSRQCISLDTYTFVTTVGVDKTALLGDLDGNGLLEVNDVVILAELAMEGGANAEQISIGDFDGSGTIDVNDVVLLAELVMGS